MVKAIVMDMDGTLLNENSEIPQKTKEALLQLERQGLCIVLASGRSVFRLQPIIEELQLKTFGGYCIEINGMAYVDLQKNKRNVLRRMDHKDACELFEYCKKTDAEVMVFYDDGLFDYHSARIHAIKEELRRQKQLPADYPWTGGPWEWLMDLRSGYPHISYITSSEEINHVVNKVQIIEDEEAMKKIYPPLYEKYHDSFEIYRTSSRLVEIMPKGVSKGKGLQRLMAQKGWKKDEVITFGDGENDISMFHVVKDSYAMGQAEEFVRRAASHVTLPNTQEGVLHALKTIFPTL